MKIAVLHNEVAAESSLDEQDNLIQTRAVSHALAELGHEPVPLPLPAI